MTFEQRLFCYSMLLQLRHFPERVVPIATWLHKGKGPKGAAIGKNTFDYRSLGGGLSLDYFTVCIPDLIAEEYLEKDNPLAWGLAARMERRKMDKVGFSLACQKKITRSRISDVKRLLLLDICKTYVKLNPKEEARMQAQIDEDPEYEEIKYSNLTYFGKIAYDAAKAAEASTAIKTTAAKLLEVLEARALPITDEMRRTILACKDLPSLDRWFRRALRATSAAEVFE